MESIYFEEIEKLVNIAAGQDNLLNINTILLAFKLEEVEELDLIAEITSRGITILQNDIEPDVDGIDIGNIQPFDPSKISISMKQLSIEALAKRIRNNEIEFEIAYQRKAGLWSDTQKSRLIESLMLRIPLPAFYIDAKSDDKWVIIDGLQRTTTIKEFMIDQTLVLQGMEFFKDLEGLKFDALPRLFQRRIEEEQINIYLVAATTPENVKYNIFKRINTGGLSLEPQEIRNALYQGNSTQLLLEMAQYKSFLKATANKVSPERMLDREFVLRFIAFTYQSISSYNGLIDDFLISAMMQINSSTEVFIKEVKKDFEYSMTKCYAIFGDHAFRKMAADGRKRPINKVLFETWSSSIAKLDKENVDILVARKKTVQKKFISLCENEAFVYSLRGSDKYAVTNRINSINEMITDCLE